jgi:hypothetical protein
VINLTITYKGEGSDFAASVGIAYVTSSGAVINSSDTWAVPPEPALDGLGELYTGGSATGNEVIAIPVDDPGVWRIRPGIFADEVFVALQ